MLFRKKRIYADAAAATPMSDHARSELMRLLDVYGNAGALHTEAVAAKGELDAARKMVIEAIGAHGDELIFSASGTESNNIAISGTLRPLLQKYGTLHAVTLSIEHQSVLEPLRALKAEGLELTEFPVDSEGLPSLKDLKEAITERTVFVSVMMVNSEVGTVEPIQEIAKIIRQIRRSRTSQGEGKTRPSGPERPSTRSSAEELNSASLPLYFHTDASQAPLWLPIRVEKLGVDLLTLDAQKVLGPKGVGALYIKRNTDISPVIRGGVQEKGLRGGTPNVPLAGAFAVAMKDAAAGVEARAQKIAEVRDYLYQELKSRISEVLVNGPKPTETPKQNPVARPQPSQRVAAQANMFNDRVANNLNISIPGLDGEMAVLGLDAMGIAVSTRSACNTGDEDPSHVIKALGTPKNLSKTAVRITLLPSATRADARAIADAFAKIAKRYKIVV